MCEKAKKGWLAVRTGFFFFVLLFFIRPYPAWGAESDTREDIRVGLKSRYEQKESITLYNTRLSLGFATDREYRAEITISCEEGLTVRAERGAFFELQGGRMTAERTESLAKRLREAGAVAYPVLFSAEGAGVYLPIAENGGTEEGARLRCEQAATACGVMLKAGKRESGYLIRLTAGDRILLADGAEGEYPQFASLEKDEKGIFTVDLGDRRYRGRIEIGRYGGRTAVTAVNVVPLEEYLYGVVPCEMPASWHQEALKAQAVCARSYALVKAGYHARTDSMRGYRMVDTEQSQVYGGAAFENERSTAAVNGTRGETLCYGNRTIAGYYFAASGGHTENSEDVWSFSLPYLRGVPDIYESNPSKKPWSVTLSREALANALLTGGKRVGTVQRVTQEITTASGRVYSLKVTGSLMTAGLNTDILRNLLQLPSTKFKMVSHTDVPDQVAVQGAKSSEQRAIHDCFVLDGSGEVRSAEGLAEQYVVLSAGNLTNFPRFAPKEGEYLFAGMGSGHGVGMSQSGARGMAEYGFTYREILEHYFTGISIR